MISVSREFKTSRSVKRKCLLLELCIEIGLENLNSLLTELMMRGNKPAKLAIKSIYKNKLEKKLKDHGAYSWPNYLLLIEVGKKINFSIKIELSFL